jgi:hypothetical protein
MDLGAFGSQDARNRARRNVNDNGMVILLLIFDELELMVSGWSD